MAILHSSNPYGTNSIFLPYHSMICGNADIIVINKIKIDPWNFFKGCMIIFLRLTAKFSWWNHFTIQRIYNLVCQKEKQQESHVDTIPLIDATTI